MILDRLRVLRHEMFLQKRRHAMATIDFAMEIIARHDKRVTELLRTTEREVERRRAAEAYAIGVLEGNPAYVGTAIMAVGFPGHEIDHTAVAAAAAYCSEKVGPEEIGHVFVGPAGATKTDPGDGADMTRAAITHPENPGKFHVGDRAKQPGEYRGDPATYGRKVD